MLPVFGKVLGIEINDGYVTLGFRSGGKLRGLTRFEAPVADGAVLDPAPLLKILRDYTSAHRLGRAAMLTVKTSQAILRIAELPERLKPRKSQTAVSLAHMTVSLTRKAEGASNRAAGLPQGTEPETAEPPCFDSIFPTDAAGYESGCRQLDSKRALACRIPSQISGELSKLAADAGLTLLRLSVYTDSLCAALEHTGKNAVCVTDEYVIYVENGILTELAPLIPGIGPTPGWFSGVVLDYIYDLKSSTSPSAAEGLALRGLLGIA